MIFHVMKWNEYALAKMRENEDDAKEVIKSFYKMYPTAPSFQKADDLYFAGIKIFSFASY